MCFLPVKGMLVSVMGDHWIHFWHPKKGMLIRSMNGTPHSRPPGRPRPRFFQVSTNAANDILLTADDEGFVYVYDISRIRLGTKSIHSYQLAMRILFQVRGQAGAFGGVAAALPPVEAGGGRGSAEHCCAGVCCMCCRVQCVV